MVKSEQKRKAAATVCILQHIHCETPGIILDYLQSAGIEMRFVHTFEQNPIPSNLDTQAGLIVMGGPMSVYDHEQFPFLLDEQRLIEQALKDDKPVLGVCLGSQLLAATLVVEVKSGAQKEIGWHPVTLTEYAATDKNRVPLSDNSNFPALSLLAPVNAPFMCPKSSVSARVSGKAAQFR
jgi:GMP synthase-like glutamine amidotransferase